MKIVLVDARRIWLRRMPWILNRRVGGRHRGEAGRIEDGKGFRLILLAVGRAGPSQTYAEVFSRRHRETMNLVRQLAVLSPRALWMIATSRGRLVYLIHSPLLDPSQQSDRMVNGNDTSRFAGLLQKPSLSRLPLSKPLCLESTERRWCRVQPDR